MNIVNEQCIRRNTYLKIQHQSQYYGTSDVDLKCNHRLGIPEERQRVTGEKLLWCPKSSIGFTKHYRAADGGQPAVIRVRK
jgi:hypothetical protein